MNEPPRIRITRSAPLPQTSFLGRFLTLTAAGLLVGGALIAAITFSLILLPVVLLIGAIGIGYLWFKTRGVRRQFTEQVSAMQAEMARQQAAAGRSAGSSPGVRPGQGEVIDGDFIHEAPRQPSGSSDSSR